MGPMYVLVNRWTNTTTRTVAASADLDTLKESAEAKLRKDTGSTRFRWERYEDDEVAPLGTDRLLLLRWSNVSEKWIGSGSYIDTVPVLHLDTEDTTEEEEVGLGYRVYSEQEDHEWMGEADPSDPDDWSNR